MIAPALLAAPLLAALLLAAPLLAALLLAAPALGAPAQASRAPAPSPTPAPAFDATRPQFGQPHRVTWDRYSPMIDGQRLTIWSAEFHYFRLPSPTLWRDVLEKIKAGGFNTVSLYFSWAYHSSAAGTYDFSGVRDVEQLLRIAEQAGLYVIVRPGPYINAELDAGGFPGWLTTQLGAARTAAPDYASAWMDWLSHLDPIIARHQITRGGSVIAYQVENELARTENNAPYMRAIVGKVRSDGIDVPTTANLIVGPTWSDVVDLDGPDIYPNGFSCGTPNSWSGGLSLQIDHMELNARSDAPATPEFLPEFQGGSFDPWGGTGYANCYQLTNGAFEKVLNQTASAQGVTMRNLYMTYGGTSWGWQAVPSDYSSYDYGAPINEARELTPKFYDLKRMAYASSAITPLSATDAAGTPSGSNSDLLYEARQNPNTRTQFIFLRHADPTSTADASTTLSLTTSDGSYPTVPQQPGTAIHVHGRDMMMLVADYEMGAAHLVYSTSQLMTNTTTGGRDVTVLYGARGDPGETVLRYTTQPQVSVLEGRASASWDAARGDLRLDYVHDGLTRVLIHGPKRDLLLVTDDEQDSGKVWLTGTEAGPVVSYGPYLVRSATLTGGVLALRGDTAASFPQAGQLGGATDTSAWSAPLAGAPDPTPLRILAAPPISRVTWNRSPIPTTAQPGGALAGSLRGPPPVPPLPGLTHWRFHSEAPEAQPGFDDSHWTLANHASTNNVSHPPDTVPVLYMDDYGFHYGNVWYRGHFTATGTETGISLDCATGGAPSTCSAWINGRFIASSSASGSQTFAFPPGAVGAGRDNVVSVLVENDGHQEDPVTSVELHKDPRGLKGASLQGSPAPLTWRIQGTQGAEHPADTLRGPLNSGGLFGEREGWHLPGFDASSWRSVRLPDRWPADHVPPGVGWYRTGFDLNLPPGEDIPIGLRISDDPRYSYEALIFLNGWMMGRYANGVGPQKLFYLPEGVLDPRGHNALAIAVLSHGADGSGGGLGAVSLQAYGRYRGFDLGPAPAAAAPPGGCPSRRNFVIRLPRHRGARLRSVRVYVNGHRVRAVHPRRGGRRLRSRIDLRGLPPGTVRVRVVERTRSGRRIVQVRTYHTCAPKRRRHARRRSRHRRAPHQPGLQTGR